MALQVRCVHCGNDRNPDLTIKCPNCGSKQYSLGGYLYPQEGNLFKIIVVVVIIVLLLAVVGGIVYVKSAFFF